MIPTQANQDLFALSITGQNGIYIEMGAAHAINYNNTYSLEMQHGWRGFSVELFQGHEDSWNSSGRINPVYWADAITFNYTAKLDELGLPHHVNYLSCDLEPPKSTFAALRHSIENGVSYDAITFEHDLYNPKFAYNLDGRTYKDIAEEYMLSKGYKIAVTNVCANNRRDRHFETWFVGKHVDFETIDYFEWIKTL